MRPQPTALPSNGARSPEWDIQEAIERQFAQARRAWVQYQLTRQRDAVYGYLSVILAIVQHWKILDYSRAPQIVDAGRFAARTKPAGQPLGRFMKS